MRLQEWLGDGGTKVADFRPPASQSQIVFDELMSTGAVITGRRTGDFAPALHVHVPRRLRHRTRRP
jgi:hypothetical protein